MADEEAVPGPQSPMPVDPVSDLMGLAAMHHETFEAYKKVGFTPGEALALVIAWISKPS